MEGKQRSNELALWRKFDREEKHPVAKGTGLIGIGDWKLAGSMWPSKSGKKADGSPWQVWNVSLQPAQGETRKLVAVPSDLVDKVLALINGTGGTDVPSPAEPPSSIEDIPADDIPF